MHQAPNTCLRSYLCASDSVEVAEELDAISRPQLNLFVPDANELPQYRVDQFALVDSNFQALPIDSALLAAGHDIFLYGTIKPLIQFSQPEVDNAPQQQQKQQLARLGPIDEWFLFGFDGGLDLVVVISTEYAHYLVEQAAPPYAPHHTPFLARALVCKFVFETLLGDYAISFEQLVERCSEKLARWKSCTRSSSSSSTASSASAKTDDDAGGSEFLMNDGIENFEPTKDYVIENAQFIVDQLLEFDDDEIELERSQVESDSSSRADACMPLIDSPAIVDLIDLSSAIVQRRKRKRQKSKNSRTKSSLHAQYAMQKHEQAKVLRQNCMSVTTPLIQQLFDDIFRGKLKKASFKDDNSALVSQNKKFAKNANEISSVSLNQAKDVENESDIDYIGDIDEACDVNESYSLFSDYGSITNLPKKLKDRNISLIDPLDASDQLYPNRSYFSGICFDSSEEVIPIGSFVRVHSNDENLGPDHQHKVAYLTSLFKDFSQANGIKSSLKKQKKDDPKIRCHLIWLLHGTQTVIGDVAEDLQYYLSTICVDTDAAFIESKIDIKPLKKNSNWQFSGGTVESDNEIVELEKSANFYFQFTYDHTNTRFIKPHIEILNSKELSTGKCPNCDYLVKKILADKPLIKNVRGNHGKLENSTLECDKYFELEAKEYYVGNYVFIPQGSVVFKSNLKQNFYQRLENEIQKNAKPYNHEKHDRSVYTEQYRKAGNSFRNLNFTTPDPFQIGMITDIFLDKPSNQCFVTLKMLARATDFENISPLEAIRDDLNRLYITDIILNCDASMIIGKANVYYSNKQIELYSTDPDLTYPVNFYFNSKFDFTQGKFTDLCEQEAKNLGFHVLNFTDHNDSKAKTDCDFRIFDIFSGCGGLSCGLETSLLGNPHWAIEFEPNAAEAFRENHDKHSKCEVFCENSNEILQEIIDGKEYFSKTRQRLPKAGEVDLLCGGPPCQGFSGMNRFNMGEYSQFKNSLVANCLSFVEKLRPKFALIENVRNFASYNNSIVLRLTLQTMIRIGYQVTFAILQAGSYGVSQTRRRFILLAAAPDQNLPYYPEPLHCFSANGATSVTVNGVRHNSNIKFQHLGAPLRSITNYDSIGDLLPLDKGYFVPKTKPNILIDTSEINKHINSYQQFMKFDIKNPSDHVCKDLKPLIYQRVSYIPVVTGSDWRDLPNIALTLPQENGRVDKLKYINEKKHVCSCQAISKSKKKKCDPCYRQNNTLIPWCLPHTSERHNNWSGLYGRLPWSGFFGTTITNPEPMGKQGRVLHPDQNRVISVRECARSQGFRDNFKFYGSIYDKHRQVGNAVPPPLARAIGMSFRQAISQQKNA